MAYCRYKHDPLTDETFGFVAESLERAEIDAQIYEDLALKYGFTFKEIFRMTRMAIYKTIDALDDKWKPDLTLEKLKHDRERLGHGSPKFYPPGLAELLEIHDRARRALASLAEHEQDPIKKMKFEAMLEPSAEWLEIEREAQERAQPDA
jgi:hypothetical protein